MEYTSDYFCSLWLGYSVRCDRVIELLSYRVVNTRMTGIKSMLGDWEEMERRWRAQGALAAVSTNAVQGQLLQSAGVMTLGKLINLLSHGPKLIHFLQCE